MAEVFYSAVPQLVESQLQLQKCRKLTYRRGARLFGGESKVSIGSLVA